MSTQTNKYASVLRVALAQTALATDQNALERVVSAMFDAFVDTAQAEGLKPTNGLRYAALAQILFSEMHAFVDEDVNKVNAIAGQLTEHELGKVFLLALTSTVEGAFDSYHAHNGALPEKQPGDDIIEGARDDAAD